MSILLLSITWPHDVFTQNTYILPRPLVLFSDDLEYADEDNEFGDEDDDDIVWAFTGRLTLYMHGMPDGLSIDEAEIIHMPFYNVIPNAPVPELSEEFEVTADEQDVFTLRSDSFTNLIMKHTQNFLPNG